MVQFFVLTPDMISMDYQEAVIGDVLSLLRILVLGCVYVGTLAVGTAIVFIKSGLAKMTAMVRKRARKQSDSVEVRKTPE